MEAVKNPFVWVEIYVNDMPRAQKFYETVLAVKMEVMPMPNGMDIDESSDEYFEMVMFPGDMQGMGISGALVKTNMIKPGAGGTLVYFTCDDCAVALTNVEAAGGKIITAKMPIGEHGFCGVGQDTEGNPIGFHSMK